MLWNWVWNRTFLATAYCVHRGTNRSILLCSWAVVMTVPEHLCFLGKYLKGLCVVFFFILLHYLFERIFVEGTMCAQCTFNSVWDCQSWSSIWMANESAFHQEYKT